MEQCLKIGSQCDFTCDRRCRFCGACPLDGCKDPAKCAEARRKFIQDCLNEMRSDAIAEEMEEDPNESYWLHQRQADSDFSLKTRGR